MTTTSIRNNHNGGLGVPSSHSHTHGSHISPRSLSNGHSSGHSSSRFEYSSERGTSGNNVTGGPSVHPYADDIIHSLLPAPPFVESKITSNTHIDRFPYPMSNLTFPYF
ncbi:uncharacterized protein L201_001857 [Kwoniella dendrophila CBS 6074]|uniref:Uncharacterized protein n=1 Tax=Kwoniella dendrophila CBS 6074 TaxID=1295534 RepID=A0AAX4JPH8_9TREE